VLLHRLSAHHFTAGRRLLARFFWHLNLLLTGADIGPISQSGPGLVILHPISTQIFGRIGADCTIWGHGGIGGGRGEADIGAGPGLPILGDRVTLAPRATVLGAVRIGDDCVLGAGVVVMRDLPANSEVQLPDRLFRVVRDGAVV
jgi:serine O-acetyltransferase